MNGPHRVHIASTENRESPNDSSIHRLQPTESQSQHIVPNRTHSHQKIPQTQERESSSDRQETLLTPKTLWNPCRSRHKVNLACKSVVSANYLHVKSGGRRPVLRLDMEITMDMTYTLLERKSILPEVEVRQKSNARRDEAANAPEPEEQNIAPRAVRVSGDSGEGNGNKQKLTEKIRKIKKFMALREPQIGRHRGKTSEWTAPATNSTVSGQWSQSWKRVQRRRRN